MLLILFIVVVFPLSGATNDLEKQTTAQEGSKTVGSSRQGKFFPIIKIVSFDNVACSSDSGTVGICYSDKECDEMHGSPSGMCAEGHGVCCVFKASCGGHIMMNNTYFQNPGYPSPYTMATDMCMVEMYLPKGTVQIQLDFLTFEILGPVDGFCGNDTFVVSGINPGTTIPILCGFNTGQTLFIDVDNASGPHKLIFTSMGIPFDRKWNIKVSFLTDYDPCKAPPRCLQYFTDPTGTISSFNYDRTAPQLLNDLGYSICFGYVPGFCNVAITANNLDIGIRDGTLCTEDYIGIAGSTICGTSVNTQFTANATGPIILHVTTDGDNSLLQEGFNLRYMYLPC